MRVTVIFAPGDLREGARMLLFPQGSGDKLRTIVNAVRPDITFVEDITDTSDAVVLSEPNWPEQLMAVQALGMQEKIIVFPEVATSYYDWWTFPLNLVKQAAQGNFYVKRRDLEGFVAGLGTSFGEHVNGTFVHSNIRYQPFLRLSRPDKRKLQQRVIALLGDEESRNDLCAVLTDEPLQLWERWLSRLYNGLEYMDYVVLQPGDVVLNCGIHGGGEIPYFLGCLVGQGRLVNIDPLGHDYLSEYTRRSLAAWPGLWTEERVAVHDREEIITLPVDEGGMAAGGRIGEKIEGLKSIEVRAVQIDLLVENLGLKRLDLIKMDIEGAEPRALAGAEKCIRRFRPQLAISIYHAPEHFVEIPAQLAQMLSGYDFFLKNYHFISNETILYAIPKERSRKVRGNRINVQLVT